MAVGLLFQSLPFGGEMKVMIKSLFYILSFCHEIVLNFILKWAHHSHFFLKKDFIYLTQRDSQLER